MSFLLYKPFGYTPLRALQQAKLQLPQYANAKLGAAGRLDPMAEGLLLVMVNEENNQQSDYIGLDKKYQIELLLGLSTDSYDLLGLPAVTSLSPNPPSTTALQQAIQQHVGTIIQPFPPYSAARVNGRPLYWWARNNQLSTIEIPSMSRDVYSINIDEIYTISTNKLLDEIIYKISQINGDFRQQLIIKSWQDNLSKHTHTSWPVVQLTIHASSGTYMRSIVHSIGQNLGLGATTKHILRTQIGPHHLDNAIKLNQA